MGLRLTALALVVTGCGRLGFEAHVTDTAPPADADPDALGGSDAADAVPDAPPQPLALAQASTVAAVTGNVVVSLPAASSPGTLLVVTLATNFTGGVTPPTGWLLAQQATTSGVCAAEILYYPNNPGGITTVTFTQLAGDPAEGVISEWTGVAATSPVDAIGATMSSTQATMQTVQTAAAPTAAGELAITSYCEDVNNPTYTAGTGWTRLGTYTNSSASPSFETDYQVGVPAQVIAETTTSSVQAKFQAAIATFKIQ